MRIFYYFRFSKSISLVFILTACVDRFQVDGFNAGRAFPAVIDGFISNAEGPYTITVTQSYDVGQTKSFNEPYRVKKMIVSDNTGQEEVLTEAGEGIYQINSIKGVVGNAYKLRVEFLDGRVYESVADTLMANGSIDSLYTVFEQVDGAEPRYRVFVNSAAVAGNNRYLWSLRATFKARTRPENFVFKACYFFEGKCNYVPPCSGYRNIGSQGLPEIVKVYPCECCTCWYDIFNTSPVLSEDFFKLKEYKQIEVGSFPVNGWTFMEKVRVEVSMRSLSKGTYNFYKTIRDQKIGAESLFQPALGKIPTNFVQITGIRQEVYGMFYAAGLARKNIYVRRDQVPRSDLLPNRDDPDKWGFDAASCIGFFPNSTNVKPGFWED